MNNNKTTNLTHAELVALVGNKINQLFQIRVQSNPKGGGGEQILNAYLDEYGGFSTHIYGQNNIDGIDYAHSSQWIKNYTGTFGFLGYMVNENSLKYKKPEVLAVGTKVRVTEEARKCGDYEHWSEKKTDMVGKVFQVTRLYDTYEGISYEINYEINNSYLFPHYCVEPAEDEPVETITIQGKTFVKSEYEQAINNLKEVKKY